MFTDPHTAATAAANSTPARKFMFDRSFDDAKIVHRVERKPVLMKPEQIDALRKEGFDAGFEAGRQAGRDEQVAQQSAILQTIDRNMAALVEKLGAIAQEQNGHMRHMVLAIAKKILPTFAAQNGLQEIETILSDTIREMAREPRLVVRVHEQQFDVINERVQAIAAQRAYAGKVIVLADADVMAGDCRVEWADGGIERDTQSTWRAVEQTINPTL